MAIGEFLIQTAVQTTANIISNLGWFFLIIWGVKTLSRQIYVGFEKLGSKVPGWLKEYENIMIKKRAIDGALSPR